MAEKLNPITFPLHGTRLIEASAGTGKTYTIAALYLRLILGHGCKNGFSRPLTPPEILVVTFTKKATEELKDRIRKRLVEAADFFWEIGNGDDFLKQLRTEYKPENWKMMAMQLDQAAQCMDEAGIYTIHAWARLILSQHAFTTIHLFDLKLHPENYDLLEQASCDFWRAELYKKETEILSEFMNITGISTPQKLLTEIMPLINTHEIKELIEKNKDYQPFEMIEERLKEIEKAKSAWALDFEIACRQMTEAQTDKRLNNNKYRNDSLKKWLAQMDVWVNQNGPLPELAVLKKLSSRGLAEGTAKKQTPPTHPAYEALDRLCEQLDDQKIKRTVILHATVEIMRRTKRSKNRLARIGYNDLLVHLDEALSGPKGHHLARVIRNQFPIAMIDEFQDTDPVQYRTFCAIYMNQEENGQSGLLMIGDPKQSIYAFRGADIYTYLKAKKDTADRHYTLKKNYRSASGMVEAINQIFCRAKKFNYGPFMFKNLISFEPALAQGLDKRFIVEETTQTPLTLWEMKQDEPINKTGEDGYLNRMAMAGAAKIVRLLNLGSKKPCQAGFKNKKGDIVPLKPSDIAVLVRDGIEARTMKTALDIHRIGSVYLSDRESVFDCPEALSLLYLLKACSNPSNNKQVKAALATPILNLPLDYLDKLNKDETILETELQKFNQLHLIWQNRGVLAMIKALSNQFNVAARLLSKSSGERSLTNLLHLAEILHNSSSHINSQQGIIRWFIQQIELSGSDIDERILRLESDQALVQIVTIHKAKGLEYPLVFLPFICNFRKMTKSNSPIVKYHDDLGQMRLIVNPDPNIIDLADRERLAEDLRMLYVAMTRACHACWLGIGLIRDTRKKIGNGSTEPKSAFEYLLKGGKITSTKNLSDLLQDFRGECQAIRIVSPPVPSNETLKDPPEYKNFSQAKNFQGTICKNWRISSYSSILVEPEIPPLQQSDEENQASNKDVPQEKASDDQILEEKIEQKEVAYPKNSGLSIHEFPQGPEPGTFLHDILEWAAQYGFDRIEKQRIVVENKITRFCERRSWNDWVTVLTEWLINIVQTNLGEQSDPITLSDLSPDRCKAEMEFMFSVNWVNIEELDKIIKSDVLPQRDRPSLHPDKINGMLKGFIDLVFCFKNQYFIMDYKSNRLGDDQYAYNDETMTRSILEHRYDLQYVIYTIALHRLLKARLINYKYDRNFGGIIYLFLRGTAGSNKSGFGVYRDKIPYSLVITLDHLFYQGKGHRDY